MATSASGTGKPPPSPGILAAIWIATLVIGVGLPVILHIAKIATLPGLGWVVLVIAVLALLLKVTFTHIASGGIEIHKWGHDNCQLAFAAALSMLSIQLLAPRDLFHNVLWDRVFKVPLPPSIAANPEWLSRVLQLAVFMLITLAATLLTAVISGWIKSGQTSPRRGWELVNVLLGGISLAAYIQLLLAKG